MVSGDGTRGPARQRRCRAQRSHFVELDRRRRAHAFRAVRAAQRVALAAGLEADSPRFGREVGLIMSGLFLASWLSWPVASSLPGRRTWTRPSQRSCTASWSGHCSSSAAAVGSSRSWHRARLGRQRLHRRIHARRWPDALSDAAWASVFALVIAVASTILGALAARDEVRTRFPFARTPRVR